MTGGPGPIPPAIDHIFPSKTGFADEVYNVLRVRIWRDNVGLLTAPGRNSKHKVGI